MKVVFLNSYETIGGASKATLRILKALSSNENLEVRMLVKRKQTDNSLIHAYETCMIKINTLIEKLLKRIFVKSSETDFSFSILQSSNIAEKINALDPDIVHINWVNDGFIQIRDLKKIKKPILWTLHDDWPFTGGCHVTDECKNYIHSCQNCPVLKKEVRNNLAEKVLIEKNLNFDSCNISINCPSKWLFKKSKQSYLFRDLFHSNIPNPIDVDKFAKNVKHNLFGATSDKKKIILFGAHDFISNKNKGFDILDKTLQALNPKEFKLVTFGSKKALDCNSFAYEVIDLGYIDDENDLINLYSSCDFCVVPSRQENFSNIILESLSCSLPVIAFNTGGNSDLIHHKRNGYLCQSYQIESLKEGLLWMLNNCALEELAEYGIAHVRRNFSSEVISKKYYQLYQNILVSQRNSASE